MNQAQLAVRGPSLRLVPADLWIGAAAVSSLVFIGIVAVPALSPGHLARHAGHIPMLLLHIFTGAVMLLAGALALRIGLTRQLFHWHRTVGATYLVAGTLASVSALERSFDVGHSPGLSTGTLAAVWLVFAAMAFRAIRNRAYEQHREWMIRSFVAAWTFVFCRFFTRVVPEGLQAPETEMIWFTWIVPLLLCEVALQWRRGSARAPAA